MAFANGGKIVTSGLVLALDASDRNSYVSGSTIWNDLSGNNNNGTLSGSILPTFSSVSGGNFVFDGTSSFVSIPSQSNITDFNLNQNYSVGFWSYINSVQTIPLTNNYSIVEKWNGSPSGNATSYPYAFRLARVSGTLQMISYNLSSQIMIELPCPRDVWFYTCGVFNWISSISNLYIYQLSGASTTSGTLSLTGSISNTYPINLAARASRNTNYLTCQIAGFNIYNRALSSDEVLQNYNAQKSRFNLK
jgi:hypothetical protein